MRQVRHNKSHVALRHILRVLSRPEIAFGRQINRQSRVDLAHLSTDFSRLEVPGTIRHIARKQAGQLSDIHGQIRSFAVQTTSPSVPPDIRQRRAERANLSHSRCRSERKSGVGALPQPSDLLQTRSRTDGTLQTLTFHRSFFGTCASAWDQSSRANS